MTTPTATVSAKPRLTPGFVVDVPTTRSVEVARKLDVGTLIYNTSSTSAVYLSSSPQVTPANGLKLGAFGTVHWSGGACYACVGTGVAASVRLQVSPDATDLNNPIDIAAATAAQLLASGVPNVGLTATIPGANLSNLGSLKNGVISVAFDISTYASLILTAGGEGSGQTFTVLLTFTGSNSASWTEYFSSVDGNFNSYNWIIPCLAATSVKITTFSATTTTTDVNLTGTNRIVQEIKLLDNLNMPIKYASIAAVLAVNQLVNPAVVTGSGMITQSGLCYVRATLTGAGAAGDFGYQYIDFNGTTFREIYLFSLAAPGSAQALVTMPPMIKRPVFRSGAAVSTATEMQFSPSRG